MNTITQKKEILFAIENSDVDKPTKTGPTVLVVGQLSRWQKTGRCLPQNSEIVFAEFHEITRETLELLEPDIILSSLLCPAFDCVDLAMVLDELGFHGRYRVMAPTLPKPRMILAEIAQLCPRLDFSFFLVNEPSRVRAN